MKLPRDLKPGDKLWYSKTDFATVRTRPNEQTCYYDRGGVCACNPSNSVLIYNPNGVEFSLGTPSIIRVERFTSKPAKPKPDADAVWLRKLAKMNTGPLPSELAKHAKARLRRIAKRLEGGSK